MARSHGMRRSSLTRDIRYNSVADNNTRISISLVQLVEATYLRNGNRAVDIIKCIVLVALAILSIHVVLILAVIVIVRENVEPHPDATLQQKEFKYKTKVIVYFTSRTCYCPIDALE